MQVKHVMLVDVERGDAMGKNHVSIVLGGAGSATIRRGLTTNVVARRCPSRTLRARCSLSVVWWGPRPSECYEYFCQFRRPDDHLGAPPT